MSEEQVWEEWDFSAWPRSPCVFAPLGAFAPAKRFAFVPARFAGCPFGHPHCLAPVSWLPQTLWLRHPIASPPRQFGLHSSTAGRLPPAVVAGAAFGELPQPPHAPCPELLSPGVGRSGRRPYETVCLPPGTWPSPGRSAFRPALSGRPAMSLYTVRDSWPSAL